MVTPKKGANKPTTKDKGSSADVANTTTTAPTTEKKERGPNKPRIYSLFGGNGKICNGTIAELKAKIMADGGSDTFYVCKVVKTLTVGISVIEG